MSQELRNKAIVIRDEKGEGKNTADRVGEWMVQAEEELAQNGGSTKTLQQVDDENITFNKIHLGEYNIDINARKLFYTYKHYAYGIDYDNIATSIFIPNTRDSYTLTLVTTPRDSSVLNNKYVPLFCLLRDSDNVIQLYCGFHANRTLDVINPQGAIKVSYSKGTKFMNNTIYTFNFQIKKNQIDVYVNEVLEMSLIGDRTREILSSSTTMNLANIGFVVNNTSKSDVAIGYTILSLGANVLTYNNKLYNQFRSVNGMSLPLLEGYKKATLPFNNIDHQLTMSMTFDDEYITKGNGNNWDGDILYMGFRVRVSAKGLFYVVANNISYLSDVDVRDNNKHEIVVRLYDDNTAIYVNNILIVDLPINCKYYLSNITLGKISETNYVAKFRIDSLILSEIFNSIITRSPEIEPLISTPLIDNVLHNSGYKRKIGTFGYPQFVADTLRVDMPFGIGEYFKGGDKKMSYAVLKKNISGLQGKRKISILGGCRNELGVTKIGSVKMMNTENGSSIQMNTTGYTHNGEYIHPTIAYHPTGIAGYKYWMFASNYPAENPRYEDDDVLVSNDGYNWYRLLPESMETDINKPVLPPNVFAKDADFGRENSFIPIPSANSTFKMNGQDYTPVRTLKHDPEIQIVGNEVFLYNFYNFFDDAASTKFHRFVVVISTRNGKDWFINRADGSQIEATETNLKELFTQSSIDGKNNYIRYFNNNTAGNRLDKDTAYSIVKVSDNEWYAYVGEYQYYGSSNMGLKRYKGTSHLNFDWLQWQYCTTDKYNDKTVHQDVKFINNKFYVIGRGYIYESIDGINFTEFNNTPFVAYLADGYKVDLVIGENNKVIVVCGSLLGGNIAAPMGSNKIGLPTAVWTFIQEFENFESFLDYCNNGRKDASIGALVSCHKVNNKGWYKWIEIDKINTSTEYKITELLNTELEDTDSVNIVILSTSYYGNSQWIEVCKNLLIE